MIYLDHAATTPVPRAVADAMYAVLTERYGNPSAQYPLGAEMKKQAEAWRKAVAALLDCPAEGLFFTSCGTEGDNWALRAAVWQNRHLGRHIVTTAVEHSAVLECCKWLEREGCEVTYLSPDGDGNLSAAQVLEAVRPDTAVVSVMLVNNELGNVYPIADIARGLAARNPQTLLHTDAVQGFLKVPFTPKELGADLVTICGHKVRAPKGIGGLYVRKELIPKLKPLMVGGGQERGLRPGTEATAQIAAFAAAVQAWTPGTSEAIGAVKEYAADRLSAMEGVEIVSRGDAPHVLALSLPGYPSEPVVRALGDKGFCLSSGSACHRGKPSHVFAALGLPPKTLMGVLRVSFGPESTREEVDLLCAALEEIRSQLISRS